MRMSIAENSASKASLSTIVRDARRGRVPLLRNRRDDAFRRPLGSALTRTTDEIKRIQAQYAAMLSPSFPPANHDEEFYTLGKLARV